MPSRAALSPVTAAQLGPALATHGFDLSAHGPWSALSAASRSALSGLGDLDIDRAELLLTGNTRALWPHFLGQRPPSAPEVAQPGAGPPPLHPNPQTDPLDHYTERVHRALAPDGCVLRFAHQTAPALPFQRLATELGLAETGPVGLSVHPTYGPWFGLRALYLFPHGTEIGRSQRTPSPSHCVSCSAPCKPAFAQALSQTSSLDRAGVARAFPAWLAVRDACPVGREHRYGEEQLRFHYGVDAAG